MFWLQRVITRTSHMLDHVPAPMLSPPQDNVCHSTRNILSIWFTELHLKYSRVFFLGLSGCTDQMRRPGSLTQDMLVNFQNKRLGAWVNPPILRCFLCDSKLCGALGLLAGLAVIIDVKSLKGAYAKYRKDYINLRDTSAQPFTVVMT